MNVLTREHASNRTALPLRSRPVPGSAHHAAVARAMRAFREGGESVMSLTDLSDVAGLSRFHFNRVFHRIVGIPPCQFQSLLRLDAARRLLLTTSRSIIDVSLDVGYQSLGTFTRRFTETLGLPPLRLRRAARLVLAAPIRPAMSQAMPAATRRAIRGTLTAPADFERGVILVGLFLSPVPRGYPVRCCVLAAPGRFCLTNVDDGSYYLMAAAFGDNAAPAQRLLHENILRAAARESPLVVRGGEVISGAVDLELRAPDAFDPPILTALLPLMADGRRPLSPPFSNPGEDDDAAAAS